MSKIGFAALAALVCIFLLMGGAPVFANGQYAPVYRSNGQPSGNVLLPSQTISLNTNEAATCRLSSAPGQTYDSMLLFITTGGTYHANLIQSLPAGVNNFYVKCKNEAGAINYDDYLITFTVTAVYLQTPAQSYVSAAVATPAGTDTGQTVYTTASFSNSGSATYVNFYPYLCRSDGTNCVSMTCPQYSDSRIYISAYGSASASCYATANTYGNSMIKMRYIFPGGDQTAYSGIFFVGTSYPSSGGTITATASTPGFVRVLDRIYTSITLSGSGQAAYVDLQPKLCKIDDYYNTESYCADMVCTTNQVYVNSYGSSSSSCYTTGSVVGKHRIKLNYNTPGYYLTAYSGIFNVYAIGTSDGGCTAGYTENYQCSGNVKQALYKYSDCSTRWFDSETCSYGCSGGQCQQQNPVYGSCTAGYTGNYQCSGNTKQTQYRYSDCSTAWVNSETCSYGCFGGQCATQYPASGGCTVGYTGSYQCSGNVKQGQYRYSDCGTVWSNIETCSYGCFGGQCTPQPTQPVQYIIVQPSPSVQYIVQPSPSVQYIVQPAQQTQFITQSVVSTANKCDLSISMNMKKTIEIGDSVFADGYISDQLGNYAKVPFKFYIDNVPVIDGTSNEFGYWQAGFTPDKTGSSKLKISIPSCNRERTADITVVGKPPSGQPSTNDATKSLDVDVYPESLDIGLGAHAILALETTADKNTVIKLTGLPDGWVQPSELTAETGKNYVYINPDSGAQGNYELNVSAYSNGKLAFSKKTSVYVSRQAPAGEEGSGNNLLGNAVAITLIGIAVAYAAPKAYGRGLASSEKQRYLADVKRKIEENMPFK